MTTSRGVAVALLTVLGASRLRAQAPCLRYGSETVSVTGRLERRTFYGPPGYGEDPRHDARETGFYLALARPMCMLAGRDETDTPKRGVRLVQLVLDSTGYARLRPHLRQRVTLRGALFGEHTGHHHAPVLMQVLAPMPVSTAR